MKEIYVTIIRYFIFLLFFSAAALLIYNKSVETMNDIEICKSNGYEGIEDISNMFGPAEFVCYKYEDNGENIIRNYKILKEAHKH